MNKTALRKLLAAALLVIWCLLFLRCETTEKSMIRIISLASEGQNVCVQLIYQAPEASADASEASAALQMVQAKDASLERALAAAKEQLPYTADYRLCDYLLIGADTPKSVLEEYEAMVLKTECGRTAAKVMCAGFTPENLDRACEENTAALDDLMDVIKQAAPMLPRLYQQGEGLLLPQLQLQEDSSAEIGEQSIFWKGGLGQVIEPAQAEMARLLAGLGRTWTFWLEGQPVQLRRCSVSITLQDETALVRLDCQRGYHTPQPSAAQYRQLEQLCTETVQAFWQKNTDLLHLQQYSALLYGAGNERITIKNACPQVQADVNFLPM